MYIINKIPEKAQKEKGFARYPDDFPHLSDGEKFAAWKNGEDWEIETILSGTELQKYLKNLKKSTSRHCARDCLRDGAKI